MYNHACTGNRDLIVSHCIAVYILDIFIIFEGNGYYFWHFMCSYSDIFFMIYVGPGRQNNLSKRLNIYLIWSLLNSCVGLFCQNFIQDWVVNHTIRVFIPSCGNISMNVLVIPFSWRNTWHYFQMPYILTLVWFYDTCDHINSDSCDDIYEVISTDICSIWNCLGNMSWCILGKEPCEMCVE